VEVETIWAVERGLKTDDTRFEREKGKRMVALLSKKRKKKKLTVLNERQKKGKGGKPEILVL